MLPLGCLSSYIGFLISILHVSISDGVILTFSLRIKFFLKSKDNLGVVFVIKNNVFWFFLVLFFGFLFKPFICLDIVPER